MEGDIHSIIFNINFIFLFYNTLKLFVIEIDMLSYSIFKIYLILKKFYFHKCFLFSI